MIATIGVVFFTKLGQTTPSRSLQLAPVYGQAFVASLFAIIVLAVITLIFVSLLPSPNQQKAGESSSKEAMSKMMDHSQIKAVSGCHADCCVVIENKAPQIEAVARS